MDQKRDFTLSEKFSSEEVQKFINELHGNGQHVVPIVDVGIPTEGGTDPFTRGMDLGVFLKNKDGNLFKGRVSMSLQLSRPCVITLL